MGMNAFAALSDKTRREIVRLVAVSGELTSSDISKNFKMSPPAVSQHLKVLKEAKVLTMKKQAQQRLYSINGEGIGEIEEWLMEIKKMWDTRLDNLDKYLLNMKNKKRKKDGR